MKRNLSKKLIGVILLLSFLLINCQARRNGILDTIEEPKAIVEQNTMSAPI